jgi:hypothetical protein
MPSSTTSSNSTSYYGIMSSPDEISAARKTAGKDNCQSKSTARNSYEGIMPSPYESVAAQKARMSATQGKQFW